MAVECFMSAFTPEEAEAYLARWKEVREKEAAALPHTPFDVKLRQLNALMASRSLFSDPKRQEAVNAVRERWTLLRALLGG